MARQRVTNSKVLYPDSQTLLPKVDKPLLPTVKLQLLLSHYVTIQPLLDLYLSCQARCVSLVKMRDRETNGPMHWREYDYWLALHLVDLGMSQKTAEDLAPIFVCVFFHFCKVGVQGNEIEPRPVTFKYSKRDNDG